MYIVEEAYFDIDCGLEFMATYKTKSLTKAQRYANERIVIELRDLYANCGYNAQYSSFQSFVEEWLASGLARVLTAETDMFGYCATDGELRDYAIEIIDGDTIQTFKCDLKATTVDGMVKEIDQRESH